MRTALLPLSAGLALIGCNNDYQLTKAQRPDAELTLEVTSPTYGDFLGDELIAVTGTVSPNYAILEVEGERAVGFVLHGDDGSAAKARRIE